MTDMNDAVVLAQLRDHWQKIAAVLVWKMNGGKGTVRLTHKDIKDFADSEKNCVFVHGRADAIELTLVSMARGEEIAKYEREQKARETGGGKVQ